MEAGRHIHKSTRNLNMLWANDNFLLFPVTPGSFQTRAENSNRSYRRIVVIGRRRSPLSFYMETPVHGGVRFCLGALPRKFHTHTSSIVPLKLLPFFNYYSLVFSWSFERDTRSRCRSVFCAKLLTIYNFSININFS